jgi:hypothetical protein
MYLNVREDKDAFKLPSLAGGGRRAVSAVASTLWNWCVHPDSLRQASKGKERRERIYQTMK